MMFGSEVLDVAIGMILMFLLMSLVCSSIKEALETVLNHRSKDLERGIREMLGDVQRQGIVPALYKHPLIDGLFRGEYQPGKTRNLPSYIPSRSFALALMDLLAQSALKKRAGDAGPGEHMPAEPDFELFREAVAALPADSHLRGALVPIVTFSKGDAHRLLIEIERWFDASMDRVSGWYKKRTQVILALIGLSLTVAMNVDSLALVRYLNTSQTARQLLIAHVQDYQRANAVASSGKPNTTELIDPMGWLERQGGVPLGWVTHRIPGQTDDDFNHDWRRLPNDPSKWLFKIAGMLFTAFAITLGAPFWFDVLNRFMVVRSTVKPQEKSQNEPSKA